jgi:MarR family 2-MHQ and catechol resistance regulon transcriptional repressor
VTEEMNVFDDGRITAIGLLVETYTGLSARFAAQFEAHGLSAVEFEVLMRLARSPGHQLRMTDLAAQTSLSTSGVTRVVDRMERDGLLTRRACPSDRRSSYAVVTAAGRQRLNETLPGHLELIEQWFTGQLDPVALCGLLDALRKVRDAVHPGAVAGSAGGLDHATDEAIEPAR